ncbi:MAG: acetate--CoA ligase family protein [Rhodospirillales bacterium]|nr:acetate--CoA ligase family protein [Rhodospirillales bacterium]MDE2577122.1 acetate--CoA ligase family protein [Rhodospirillales bacterium]
MTTRQGLYTHAQLARLLNPASIAIVGATPREGAFGERVLANLAPYGGRIHLVNARYGRIGERVCHPSVADLPEAPDCVVITVPREAVEPVVADSIARGAGGTIVFASGYSETGKPERLAQQLRLADLARQSGVPLVGPNCIGVTNYARQTRITFMPPADVPAPRAGAIGVISQSGALGFSFEQATRRGVSLSHVFTSGNSCDVDMADYLAYLAADPGCAVIALLFEGMAEPARLLRAADLAWAAGKPVVACKLAVGDHGAQAAMSHTGSLAGAHEAYRAAFARAGVVLVDDMEALIETASFFAKVGPPRAPGVAVLATSGGAAIMAADKAEAHGIALPQPEPPARAVLEARIPEFGSARNPCDVTAQVLTDPESLPACANALLDDPNFGALLIPNVYASPHGAARLPFYSEAVRRTGKPVIVAWLSEWLEGPGSLETETNPDVPLFRSMDRAFAAIAAWQARAALAAGGPRRLVRRSDPAAGGRAAALLAVAGHATLTEREAKQVLELYGVPVVRERLVQSADEAAEAAEALGFPAALKVESPDLPHKTEAGVIRLNLRGAAEVRAAYAAVMANAARVDPPARINGVLVQPMAPQGVELVIGGRVDPLFGPLVIVGLGGVLVELLADTQIGLAPVTPGEARGMLDRLRGAAVLRGFRGGPPVDLDGLADVLVRVSEFLADHCAAIAEIDINPLICAGARMVAVDALIVKAARR